jgi:hypothetical protein
LKPALIDLEENIFIYYMAMIELKGILFCNKRGFENSQKPDASPHGSHIKVMELFFVNYLAFNEPSPPDNWLYNEAEPMPAICGTTANERS